jgi:hypothetical protein
MIIAATMALATGILADPDQEAARHSPTPNDGTAIRSRAQTQLRNEEICDRNGGLAPTEGTVGRLRIVRRISAAYSPRVAKSSEPCFIKCYGDITGCGRGSGFDAKLAAAVMIRRSSTRLRLMLERHAVAREFPGAGFSRHAPRLHVPARMDRAEARRLASVIVTLREMLQDPASMPASSTGGSLSTASIDAGFCEDAAQLRPQSFCGSVGLQLTKGPTFD